MIVSGRDLNAFQRVGTVQQRVIDRSSNRSWQPGDFIAHFVSSTSRVYSSRFDMMYDFMEEQGMAHFVPVKKLFEKHFPIPMPSSEVTAGSCWCDGDGISMCL